MRHVQHKAMHPLRALRQDELNVVLMFVQRREDGFDLRVRKAIVKQIAHRSEKDASRLTHFRDVRNAVIVECWAKAISICGDAPTHQEQGCRFGVAVFARIGDLCATCNRVPWRPRCCGCQDAIDVFRLHRHVYITNATAVCLVLMK